ncbi:GH13819 [Drosophila grimshawi]|uniref:Mitochondrial cardiolipin hydrolase n=2 Tax=Drosophila grimshawi TaxID=7222 RepID=B4JR49_DROGR|nr:GH13819 [Drosophila grimshawi]
MENYRLRNQINQINVLILNESSELCKSSHLQDASFKCQNDYCSKRQLQSIVDEIDRAQYSIDIAMYIFTLHDLMESIDRALIRGVLVRLISDHEMNCSSGARISQLSKLGIEIRAPDTTAMMHHKFMVIDNSTRVKEILRTRDGKRKSTYRSVLVFGSINWTMQGFSGNWENCVITSDSYLGSKFQMEFERMWKAFEDSLSNVKLTA